MLDQTLLALASAAGVAVASAAGTDAWQGMRRRVAQILGRGGADERVVLERLDGVVVELGRAGPEVRDQVRARVVAAWETRFHDLLDGADDERRAELVQHLNDLIGYGNQARGEAHAGEGGSPFTASPTSVPIEARRRPA